MCLCVIAVSVCDREKERCLQARVSECVNGSLFSALLLTEILWTLSENVLPKREKSLIEETKKTNKL